MKDLICISIAALSLQLSALAEVSVNNVVAKQRYPWNGLVDISCMVSGIDETTNGQEFAVAAVMPDTCEARSVSHIRMSSGGAWSDDWKVATNGNYRLVWDARADLGEVRYSNMVVRVTTIDLHEKVQLWEGGPYWATTNIGADEPWDYGLYFWWGDTVGYRLVGSAWVASDGLSSNFSFSSGNTPTAQKPASTLQSEGWVVSTNGTYVLAPVHDAARTHWGDPWRVPTNAELSALSSNCDWTWTVTNGVNGYVVSGRGDYATSRIFLPAAGYGDGTSLSYAGSEGNYCSSVPYSNSSYSFSLGFYSGHHLVGCGSIFYGYRGYGRSVRPVRVSAQ